MYIYNLTYSTPELETVKNATVAYPAADYDCAYIYCPAASMLVSEVETNTSK